MDPEALLLLSYGEMNGAELECAKELDTLPAVRHWVRNGDSGQHAFSLPRASGNFFPDFGTIYSFGDVSGCPRQC